MIELFVFDLGNVILPFDHRQIARQLCTRIKGNGTRSPEEVFGYIFDLQDGFINPFEEGLFSSFEFYLPSETVSQFKTESNIYPSCRT